MFFLDYSRLPPSRTVLPILLSWAATLAACATCLLSFFISSSFFHFSLFSKHFLGTCKSGMSGTCVAISRNCRLCLCAFFFEVRPASVVAPRLMCPIRPSPKMIQRFFIIIIIIEKETWRAFSFYAERTTCTQQPCKVKTRTSVFQQRVILSSKKCEVDLFSFFFLLEQLRDTIECLTKLNFCLYICQVDVLFYNDNLTGKAAFF